LRVSSAKLTLAAQHDLAEVQTGSRLAKSTRTTASALTMHPHLVDTILRELPRKRKVVKTAQTLFSSIPEI